MTRFEIIIGYLLSEIVDYLDELYFASKKDLKRYHQLIDNVIACINRDLEDESLEPLSSDEIKNVILEIKYILS